MTTSIRTAGPEDIDEFVTSVAGLFRDDAGRHDHCINVSWPAAEGAEYYAGLVGRPECLLALAHDGDAVLGHLVGKLAEPNSFRTRRIAVLESIRVAPGSRGQGVGGQLVGAFFDWARDRGAEVASVTAYAANDGAQRFYRRHGFTPHDVTLRSPVPANGVSAAAAAHQGPL